MMVLLQPGLQRLPPPLAKFLSLVLSLVVILPLVPIWQLLLVEIVLVSPIPTQGFRRW
jgi:hypothetical protein